MKKGIIVFALMILLAGCSSTVRVRRGDTLYSIAKKKNVPLRALIQENNLSAPYTIKVGQLLKIPQKKTYTVRKGDTLYSIARKFDSNVTDVARQNNIKPPYTLKPGQVLVVKSWDDAGTTVTTSSASSTTTTKASSSTSSKGKTALNPPEKKAKNTPTKQAIQVPKSAQSKRFYRPISGKIIESFGTTKSGVHNDGINIAAKAGTPILAAESGTVAYAGNDLKGYGNLILLKHDGGWFTAYAHADKITVKKGATVKAKQAIGTVGKTGGVTTPQLHFEVRYKTKPVDPTTYLK
ncbi:MAG: peptidoglycan DD-metalloendopeptidase family protein [Alphaproteobacteria bacterium]|nr:peptidoglycan DD-metalloendopeptidase family protein [Alphaproteobacteria bacterium]